MDEIKVGDKFKHKTLNTIIRIIKPLGNDSLWVKGSLGEFRIRKYLIESNYTKIK